MPKLRNILSSDDRFFFFKIALIAFALLLLSSQIYHVLNYPIWRDDSFFAGVAKNLVNGQGYAAVFFDKSYPFHFGISSGPLIILPAAALMFFFGNQYWVGEVSNILLIWSLLITIFFLADKFLTRDKKWLFSFLALFFSVLFTINSYGSEAKDSLLLWHLLMGEIPAALCIIVASFLLFSPQHSVKKIIAGCLFLNLALMGKTIVGIAAALILVALGLKIITTKNLKKTQRLKLIFITGLSFLVPILFYELIKIISLGWQDYLALNQMNANFYKHLALITSLRENNGISVDYDPQAHLLHLINFFSIAGFLLIPISILIALEACKNKNASRSALFVSLVLMLCFLLHFAWWIYLSINYNRYYAVALIYYFVALALLLANIDYKNLSSFRFWIIVIFLLILIVSRAHEIQYLTNDGFKRSNSDLQQQLTAANIINDLRQKNVTLISGGNNFELEYLAQQNNNFKKLPNALNDSQHPTMLVHYFIDGGNLPRLIITVNPCDNYFAQIAPPSPDISQKCNRKYFEGKNIFMGWCK